MRTVIAVLVMFLLLGTAGAEQSQAWIMCQPDSEVNIRERPSKKSDVVCHRYMGDVIELDGKKSGDWLHCIVACENEEGWVRQDFVSFSEPEEFRNSQYEVLKNKTWARYSAGGRVRKRLDKGYRLTVYLKTAEWCVTSQGFVRTDLLAEVTDMGGM